MSFALVTGASKGIGKAMAEQLAVRKIDLLLVARSEKELKHVAEQLQNEHKVKAYFLVADLAVADSPDKIFEWCQNQKFEISILVNNAGYGLSGSFEKYSVKENLEMMQVNMLALVHLAQLFLPQLHKQKKAYIMNIASTASYQAVPGLSLYSATKAFVLSFSRGLKQELLGSSVSVTCICPGATDTGFAERAQVGAKGLKAAAKLNMSPKDVASIAVKSMFAGKTEVITGAVNKAGAFMAWLLPKVLVERVAGKMYK